MNVNDPFLAGYRDPVFIGNSALHFSRYIDNGIEDMIRKSGWQLAVIFLAILMSNLAAAQSVPHLIHFDGFLADKGGAPLPDGVHDIEFSIYDAPSGGDALWREKWDASTTRISTKGGGFSALLGSHTPLSPRLFQNHSQLYLGIKVDADSEMLPRTQIASVPFAMASAGQIPSGAIVMWSGGLNDIPDGWVLCDGAHGTPDLRARFIVGSGGGYSIGDTGGVRTSTVPNHTHGIAMDSPKTNVAGAHQHTGTTGGRVNFGFQRVPNNYDDVSKSQADHQHNFTTNVSGEHFHTVNAHNHGGSTMSGGGVSLDNRPPFYALAFIMKL